MRFITLDENNKLTAIREGQTIIEGEIESEIGEIGQIQQADGSFIDDTTPIILPVIQPTNQEIKDNQMVIMNGLTDIYMSQLGF